MEKPELSIIIPVYNADKYLDRCLNSILSQSYSDWEVILVNDGSSDLSGKICDKYAASDTRIKAIHITNGGQSRARNIALNIMRGKFLTFIDSDDYLINDDYFKIGVSMLNANPDIDIVVYSWERKNTLGETTCRHICKDTKWYSTYDYFSNYEPIKGNTSDCYYVPVWGKLYRANIFDGLKFREGMVFEDVAINADIFLNVKGILLSSIIVYAYFENQNSTMAQIDSRKSNDAIRANLYVLTNSIKVLDDSCLQSKYFDKIFYESCIIGYLSHKVLDADNVTKMNRLFKSIKDKKNMSLHFKWLIKIFGIESARKIYIFFMLTKHKKLFQ